jgi:hypothetical protein
MAGTEEVASGLEVAADEVFENMNSSFTPVNLYWLNKLVKSL